MLLIAIIIIVLKVTIEIDDTCIDTISDNKVTLLRCSSVSIESIPNSLSYQTTIQTIVLYELYYFLYFFIIFHKKSRPLKADPKADPSKA